MTMNTRDEAILRHMSSSSSVGGRIAERNNICDGIAVIPNNSGGDSTPTNPYKLDHIEITPDLVLCCVGPRQKRKVIFFPSRADYGHSLYQAMCTYPVEGDFF